MIRSAIKQIRDGQRAPLGTSRLTIAPGTPASAHIRAEPVVFSAGSRERTRDGQRTFLNMRAEMRWKLREALDPQQGEGIALLPDKRLAALLAAPTWRLKGNAIAIESKEDIYKRLGTSTDDGDAVILAWHKRRQGKRRLDPGRGMRVAGWMGV